MTDRDVITVLLQLADEVYVALDDAEAIGIDPCDIIVNADHAERLSALLDQLDTLPDEPGYRCTPNAKARWALRTVVGSGGG